MKKTEFVIVLLSILAAGVWSTFAQSGIDSPQAVSRLLEQRWSPERIKDYCRPDTRHDPSYQNLVTMGDTSWEGQIYPGLTNELGAVTWYADVRKGKVYDLSLNVAKDGEYWLLEIAGPPTLTNKPLTEMDVIARRLDQAIYWAYSLQFDLHPQWGRSVEPKTDDDKTFNYYCDLLRKDPSERRVEFDIATGRATMYTRGADGGKTVITVELDRLGNPSRFLLNGKEDKFLNRMYKEFTANWSKHLKEVRR